MVNFSANDIHLYLDKNRSQNAKVAETLGNTEKMLAIPIPIKVNLCNKSEMEFQPSPDYVH